ncbi:hypothetical protein SCATT_15150 [Streptantibioticus cattleyicolor NRRL 8057 = DSM 46488]|uniref:Uncharacterized protein n=1 Tax=Streptantibioticus cattleyicolor (strain ATCC 35852 / DSM 46488 / JCM 4925 / NBRC 14057 / NRRL 8057) TaxID=1003195 RepID=G8X201_STREN|nr:hypothetical protein SCATT_15150 [Streptantibioticus cattleyicolor NRRL 8057 = DSM 46488]
MTWNEDRVPVTPTQYGVTAPRARQAAFGPRRAAPDTPADAE